MTAASCFLSYMQTYLFEEVQKLKIVLYDLDDGDTNSYSGPLENATSLGELQITLGEVSFDFSG